MTDYTPTTAEVEEGLTELRAKGSDRPWETPNAGELWKLTFESGATFPVFAHWVNGYLLYTDDAGIRWEPANPNITSGHRVYPPVGGESALNTFDAWLEQHDEEIAADAWVEGLFVGLAGGHKDALDTFEAEVRAKVAAEIRDEADRYAGENASYWARVYIDRITAEPVPAAGGDAK